MKSWQRSLWETVRFVVVTLLIVIPIRAYVAQPFIVSGVSMVPAFQDGEYLIVDELSYHFAPPARDEVIVFKYPKDPSKYFIKRIIGLPGETVTIQNNQISVASNGQKIVINKPVIPNQILAPGTFNLGPKQYFVLGDNRNMSLDSRVWGPVPENLITGRVLFRLFPFGRAGLWPAAV